MVYAIVGSRSFKDYEKLKRVLAGKEISSIVSGGATGADSLGAQYAKEHNRELRTFLPDWKRHGRAAGIIRNKHIIDHADVVVAFWDGVSRGTANSIQRTRDLDKPLILITY